MTDTFKPTSEYKPTVKEDVMGYSILGLMFLVASIGCWLAAKGGYALYINSQKVSPQTITVYVPAPPAKYSDRIEVTPPAQSYLSK